MKSSDRIITLLFESTVLFLIPAIFEGKGQLAVFVVSLCQLMDLIAAKFH